MPSPKAKAYYGWLSWIVVMNGHLSLVEDQRLRSFSIYNIKITTGSMVKVTNKIVEKIKEMTKKAISESKASDGRGAILHDGWSIGSDHFVRLFLSFTRHRIALDLGRETRVNEPQVVLLACSPIDHSSDENGTIQAAVQFNAEQRIEFLNETLSYYGLTFDEKFITNQISDNAVVSKRVAQLLGIPHVGCSNHKFNLEIDSYVNKNFDDVIRSTRATMIGIVTSPKNRSILKTLTDDFPLLYNLTTWRGKYFMVKQWLEMFDIVKQVNRLIQDREGEQAKLIPLDTGLAFKLRVEACMSYLELFDETRLAMEKQGVTLEACRAHLDCWVEAMTNPTNTATDKLYGCGLATKWIASNADAVTHQDFEQGVIKIQRGKHQLLTDHEKAAVASLLCNNNELNGSDSAGDMEDDALLSPGAHTENSKRRRLNNQQQGQSPYVNCDYILGSVAEVEQCLDLANKLIPDHIDDFDALLFLKVNKHLWDVHTVHETLLELNMMN